MEMSSSWIERIRVVSSLTQYDPPKFGGAQAHVFQGLRQLFHGDSTMNSFQDA